MQLADHASAVVHPLVRVLDGPVKELRKDALIALTSLANSLGSDFLLFLPLVRRTIKKRSMRDPVFERIVERLEAERVQGGNSGFNNAGQLGVKMTINPNPNPSPFTSVTDSRSGVQTTTSPGNLSAELTGVSEVAIATATWTSEVTPSTAATRFGTYHSPTRAKG
jgi:hypothetical protein